MSPLAVVVTWVAFLEITGAAGFLLVRRLVPGHADLGHGLGRTLALLGWIYGPFLGASLGLFGLSRALLALSAAAVLAAALRSGLADRRGLAADLARRGGEVAFSEAVFLGSFVLFLAPLLYTDTSRFGERAMDLAMLSELRGGTRLPPANPYLAGVSLYYYYYGHLLYASVTRLLDLDPRRTYFLATATSAALAVSAAWSLLSRLAPSKAARFLGLFVTCFATNLGPFRSLASDGLGGGFLASNWLLGNAINEYPLYTFVIAELHAHAMALPVLLAALSFGLAAFDQARAPTVLAAVLVFGALGPTNLWSLPTAGLALVALGGARRGFVGALGAFAIGPFGVLAYLPFYAHLRSFSTALRWVGALHSEAAGLLLHWGIFLYLLAGAALVARSPADAQESDRAALSRALAIVGFALIVFCELAYLEDRHGGGLARATTVFKLYLDAWVLCGLAAAWPLGRLADGARDGKPGALLWSAGFAVFAIASLCAAAAGVVRKTAGFSAGPHLSATHFMAKRDPDYAAAMDWLAAAPPPARPWVVAEALDTDRESDWLPIGAAAEAYVSWPGQLVQWGYGADEIRPRIDTLERLYHAASPADACALLHLEGIDVVFFGAKEERKFGAPARSNLLAPPFRTLFASGSSALYGCAVRAEP